MVTCGGAPRKQARCRAPAPAPEHARALEVTLRNRGSVDTLAPHLFPNSVDRRGKPPVGIPTDPDAVCALGVPYWVGRSVGWSASTTASRTA